MTRMKLRSAIGLALSATSAKAEEMNGGELLDVCVKAAITEAWPELQAGPKGRKRYGQILG